MIPTMLLEVLLFQAVPPAPVAMKPAAKLEAPVTYVLGVDDQIVIRAVDVEEIDNKPIRIDNRGFVNLPMVGRIQAAGMTTDQLQAELETRLKKYINIPDVSVSVLESRSSPISILGAVQTPGVHQIQGRKNLFEVLSSAGGLRADSGYSIRITRRLDVGRIPLPSATDDPTGQFSVASVSVKSVMAATNPEENIAIMANDVITVPKAEIVYAIGAVHKSGGFVLGENETLSALQILSLAEGLDRFAASKTSKIMRRVPGSENRQEIPVDLKAILGGKAPDIPLKPEDILFVPTNNGKAAAVRTLEIAIGAGTSIATGLVLYRH